MHNTQGLCPSRRLTPSSPRQPGGKTVLGWVTSPFWLFSYSSSSLLRSPFPFLVFLYLILASRLLLCLLDQSAFFSTSFTSSTSDFSSSSLVILLHFQYNLTCHFLLHLNLLLPQLSSPPPLQVLLLFFFLLLLLLIPHFPSSPPPSLQVLLAAATSICRRGERLVPRDSSFSPR